MKFVFSISFFVFLFSSCQQQHVPEIIYYMDSQIPASQTRHIQENILFQSPINSLKKVQVFAFSGFVNQVQNLKVATPKIFLKNEFGKELVFDAEDKLIAKIHVNMNILVRYYINEGEITLVEIKKNVL